jgi:hypothetical protein
MTTSRGALGRGIADSNTGATRNALQAGGMGLANAGWTRRRRETRCGAIAGQMGCPEEAWKPGARASWDAGMLVIIKPISTGP